MAPKQKKAPAKKPKGGDAAGSRSDCGLSRAAFEEESWRVCVSMVTSNGPAEEELSRCLLSAVQQPIRAHFTLLTWDDVLQKLSEFNPKAKKLETLPPFYEHAAVAEAAKGLLDAGQDVPCELLAKVLKCLLLQVKRVDQQRRDSEQCPNSKAEEDSVDAEKSEKKSKLKRRGEVEIPTVLDQPEDGPHLYILLFGFYRPHLIAALDDVGVHVSSVIRLCSEVSEQEDGGEDEAGSQTAEANVDLSRKLDLFWSELVPVLNSGSGNSRLPDVVQLSYTVQIHSLEAKLETGIRIYGGVANLLYDLLAKQRHHQHYLRSIRLINVPAVARLRPQQAEVVPPTTPRSKKKGDIDEPASKPKTEQPCLPVDVDMRYYGNLMDRIPAESCSVPLILHCMLEQVVVSAEEPSSVQPPGRPWREDPLTSFLLRRFLPQAAGEEEQRRIQEALLPSVNAAQKKRLRQTLAARAAQQQQRPLIIRHHDHTARRFLDVPASEDLDPVQVEQEMARLLPASAAIQFRGPRGESAPCWRSIRQHLRHYCTGGAADAASWREVERFFHQSVFESLPLTTLTRDGVLERSSAPLAPLAAAPVLPWDDPPSFANLQLKKRQPGGQAEDPGNAEIRSGTRPGLDLEDIQSCRLRCLSDWSFSEHHDAAVFSQVLQSVWDQFCCVDVFRGRLNNIVYMFCHNPTGPSRHSREFWEVGLHTDVRFRNYLDHVAETISDWTREEELKREAAKARSRDPAQLPDLQTQLEEEPVIREGSLKAWKVEQERLKKEEEEEEKSKKTKNEPKGKQPKQADAKKGSTSSAGQKKGAEAVPEAPQEERAEPLPEQVFVGLSTGGMLIHVSGRVQHLRPAGGGVVRVEDTRYAEASQLLTVVVEKDGHRFCTHIHHPAVPRVKPEGPEQRSNESVGGAAGRRGSFTALLSSQARMSYSYYGPTGEAGDVLGTAETSNHLPSWKSQAPPSSQTARPPEAQESQNPHTFRSLNISLPSGLLVQVQPELPGGPGGPVGSRQQQGLVVKQCFPVGGAAQLPDLFLSEEAFRSISSGGDVIRHLRDGTTQVLFTDGTVSFCSSSTESEKREEQAQKGGGKNTAQKISWITMTPCGERFRTVGSSHKHLPATALLVVKATDPITDDVMLTREDRLVLVQKSDGSTAVEHADGTRISSWFQDRPVGQGELPLQADPSESQTRRSDEDELSWIGEDGCGPGRSSRERVVLVEKEGCTTVLMFPHRPAAQVLLADGSVVTATSQGTYKVCLPDGGRLEIDGGGTCTYVPVRPGPAGGAPHRYRMSHTDRVSCDITDPEGNHFQVLENGDSSTSLGSLSQEEQPQGDLPRLFLVQADGSAVELLSSERVEEVLQQARSDPAAALLQEPLPDSPGDFGISVLKPGRRSLWSQWILGKQPPDITPHNLRNPAWSPSPQSQKTPGPQFGTNFGPELSGGSGSQHQPIRSCPEVLEMRQLFQLRPLGPAVAEVVDAQLKEYLEAVVSREQQLEQLEGEKPPEQIPASTWTSSDLALLYQRRRGAPVGRSLSDGSSSDSASRTSRWTERLRRHRRELCEDRTLRAALRTRTCVPYFHPENLHLHQDRVQMTKSDPRTASPVLTDVSEAPQPETPPPQSPPPPVHAPPPPAVSRAAGGDREVNRSLLDVSTQTSADGALKVPCRRYKSVFVDVTGDTRKTKVRLPASVLMSSVHSEPNQKFLSVEGPVRRRCRTTSLSGPHVPPSGFLLVPSRVDFGLLAPGGSASVTVRMKNVGVDSCRFHVKQPPVRTGVRVLYTPSPVPAGLHVDLQVQLLVVAAGESEEPQTRIHHDLLIQTELEILHLPITAQVLHPARDRLCPGV